MRTREIMHGIERANQVYNALAPLFGTAALGYFLGEGAGYGSVGGFIGSLVGGEIYKFAPSVRLKTLAFAAQRRNL